MTNAEPITESATPDPGMARAGAAAAARRRELDISQRSLAADRIINAGALIAFEKGRSWPRERTRSRLEEVLQWPEGTIERIRRGEPDRPAAPTPAAGDEMLLIVQAVVSAVAPFRPSVAALPPVDDASFPQRATALLSDLRQLEAVAARAARLGTVTPTLIRALGAVRSLYDDLMLRAAAAPQATLGQRLYAARRGANLTVFETAQAAGVPERTIEAAEAGEPVAASDASLIEALVVDIV